MSEERAEIQVRAMNAADWRALYEIQAEPGIYRDTLQIPFQSEVYTDNAAAIHLYEKFGFVIEGTKRKYAFRDGEYVDAHVMARVRD